MGLAAGLGKEGFWPGEIWRKQKEDTSSVAQNVPWSYLHILSTFES